MKINTNLSEINYNLDRNEEAKVAAPISQLKQLSSQLFSQAKETALQTAQPLKRHRWSIAKFGALAALATVPLLLFRGGGVPINPQSLIPVTDPSPVYCPIHDTYIENFNLTPLDGFSSYLPPANSSYIHSFSNQELDSKDCLHDAKQASQTLSSVKDPLPPLPQLFHFENVTDSQHYQFSTTTKPFSLQTENNEDLLEKYLPNISISELMRRVFLTNQDTLADEATWWATEFAASKIVNKRYQVPSTFDLSRRNLILFALTEAVLPKLKYQWLKSEYAFLNEKNAYLKEGLKNV